LQDQDCGHAVDGFGAFFDGEIGFAQKAVGLGRGKALVPQVNGQAESLSEVLREEQHFVGLRAFGATHAQREPDDDFAHRILANHLFEGCEIGSFISALEGVQTLRGDAQGVRDGDADSSGADIQTEDAGGRAI
jgi:hypothetical protein